MKRIILAIATIITIGLSTSCNSGIKKDLNTFDNAAYQLIRDSLERIEREKNYVADMKHVEILKKQIDSIKSKHCKVSTDKYTGRTFIRSKNEPYYINSRNYVGLYLSLDSNDYNSDGVLFLYIDYFGSNWIFWENVYLLFDNENSTHIGIESYDRDDDVVDGGVTETASIGIGNLSLVNDSYISNRLDIARTSMKSKTISVKLSGKYSKEIKCNINDFKPISEIFFLMNQIRNIEEKYEEKLY